jgi:nitrilase
MSNINNLKVAAVQMPSVFLNREESVKRACKMINLAGENDADLIVFPEAFIPAYPDWVWTIPSGRKPLINELYTELLNNSIRVPDEFTSELGKAAKAAGVYLAIGINERNNEASDKSIYNTLLYFDDSGNILGKHRKLIPTGGERLMWAQGNGNTLVSFDTPIGKLGGLICWENYMPLARNVMYINGVEIYLAPTWDNSESWLVAMRHIAREGGMFVIGCCQAIKMSDIPDKYEFKSYYPDNKVWINKGNSCVINPKGEFIAGPLCEKQEILYAELDLTEIPAQKWMFDVAGHYSRNDVFNFSLKKEGN